MLDTPIVSDATFDTLVVLLEKHWDALDHPHKSLIDRGLLKSGFYLQYPGIVKGAAEALLVWFPQSQQLEVNPTEIFTYSLKSIT